MRKTKIVCTLGPASAEETVMEQMLRNGMNVARLNFSHGTHASHKKMMDTFRRVRDRLGIPAAVMLDTKGPEIRIGDFAQGAVDLVSGAAFALTTRDVIGDEAQVHVSYDKLPARLQVGDRVLIDDGAIELEVERLTQTDIHCKVKTGGTVRNRKGVNVPSVSLKLPFLSEQDKADLIFGIEQDVDYIAASFVRTKEDVIEMREFLDAAGGRYIKIISKIENMEGVENFEEILKYSDGIMVARGDMGVEVDYERLPGLQKRFIRRCRQCGKIVITATQMLESMVNNITPTRAEITDVANAVFDGTSAIMLSGETAAGVHPALVVDAMSRIAQQAERDSFELNIYQRVRYENNVQDITNAISDAACTTARDVGAKAIIAVTRSGRTAFGVSKFRPFECVIGATPYEKTYHQLALSWGVVPIRTEYQKNTNDLFYHVMDCAKRFALVEEQDIVVITAGFDGITDIIKVQEVPGQRSGQEADKALI